MAYGTLQLSDLLITTQPSIIKFGEDKAFEAIDEALAVHNALMEDKIKTFVNEVTTDRLRRYGGVASMTMEYTDEFNRVDAQKVLTGQTVGFPLRQASIALQWTRKYMETHTPAELAAQFVAAQDADSRLIDTAIMQTVFRPTNNTTWTDRLLDNLTVPLYALTNADGQQLPLGPNGEVFDGTTHTHYVATSSLTSTDVSNLITNVTEHYGTGTPLLYINRAQEASVRAMTSNFTPYIDARVIPAETITVGAGALDMSNLYNRAIGLFDQAEVWVKPWIPASYMLCWMQGEARPLVMRTRDIGTNNLALDFENDSFPLRARQMSREFGFGVWQRHAAAVLYIGGSSYVTPAVAA